jgi:hypothetical protein
LGALGPAAAGTHRVGSVAVQSAIDAAGRASLRPAPAEADDDVGMSDQRPRYGPLVSALGAAAVGVSVFLPWYGLTLTQSGVESAQRSLTTIAQQYGNGTFQTAAGSLSSRFGSLAGEQLGTLSAHDVLKVLSVVLLVLAAIGLIAALSNLAGAARTSRGQIALVGLVAGLGVAFRIVDTPAPEEGVFTLSVQWGAWLALVGSGAMILGDLWPGSKQDPMFPSEFSKAIEELSGWTPRP